MKVDQGKIKRRVSRIISMMRDESGSREDQEESLKDHLDDESGSREDQEESFKDQLDDER